MTVLVFSPDLRSAHITYGHDGHDGRRKYSDGLAHEFSEDGVNRLMVVFITAGNEENYDLIQKYLQGLNLTPGEWTLCSDYKVKYQDF